MIKRIIIYTFLFNSLLAYSFDFSEQDLNRRYNSKQYKELANCYNKRSMGKRSPLCRKVLNIYKQKRKYKVFKRREKSLLFDSTMEFDPTSFTSEKLGKYNICSNNYTATTLSKKNTKIKLLAMAIVYFGPSNGSSILGHIGERYIYCQGDRLRDILFDYTKFTKNNYADLRNEFPEIYSKLSKQYLGTLNKKSYIQVRLNPATKKVYGHEQLRLNRNIIETWLEVEQQAMYLALKNAYFEYHQQNDNLNKNIILPEYDLISNNCTTQIIERLNNLSDEYKIDNFTITPKNIFSVLQKRKKYKTIIYPSQRLFRQMIQLQKGDSLFWDNFTFLTKNSNNQDHQNGLMIIYPEVNGALSNLLLTPTASALNFLGSFFQATWGLIQSPFYKSKGLNNITEGSSGMALSTLELTGFRTRYPKPTNWSKQEIELIKNKIPEQSPKILELLLIKIKEG